MLTFLRNLMSDLAAALTAPRAPARSPHWPAVERAALARDGNRCLWCLRSLDAVPLVGHHVVPFHTRPDLELRLANVRTLCQPLGGGCHLHQGHRDPAGRCAWGRINPRLLAELAARENLPPERRIE